jgi:hypothetical protein
MFPVRYKLNFYILQCGVLHSLHHENLKPYIFSIFSYFSLGYTTNAWSRRREVATALSTEGAEFESRQSQECHPLHVIQTSTEVHQPVKSVTGTFSKGVNRSER